jgi:DNA-binding transcriptional regulator YhcF (GntR family)
VELKEGQFIFGRNKAATELSMNPSTVYKYLSVIENEGLVCTNRNNKFTVVTIANWVLYQTVEHENEQQMNNKRTTNEQQMNTNKNVKNVKNIYDHFYEQIWSMYPVKKGKAKVSLTQKKKLHAIGLEEMTRAINRYKKENEGKDKQYIQHGSTFFNSGYVDYLDANYEQTKSTLKEVEIEW